MYLSDVRNSLIPERGVYLNENWIEADAAAAAVVAGHTGSLLAVAGIPEYHDVHPFRFLPTSEEKQKQISSFRPYDITEMNQ